MSFFAYLDSLFAPLIVHPTFFILLISFSITAFVTVLNLVLIKKDVRDRIKSQTKYFQTEMKKAQKEKNMKKMQDLQKSYMETQFLHMKEMLKVSLASIVVLWVVFAWMQHLYVHETVLNENGIGTISYNDQLYNLSVTNGESKVMHLNVNGEEFDLKYEGFIIKDYRNDNVELFNEEWKTKYDKKSNKITFNLVMADLPFFGKVGLIGWYILTALAFGVILRKIFD